jgi:hypothetical protein
MYKITQPSCLLRIILPELHALAEFINFTPSSIKSTKSIPIFTSSARINLTPDRLKSLDGITCASAGSTPPSHCYILLVRPGAKFELKLKARCFYSQNGRGVEKYRMLELSKKKDQGSVFHPTR